ARRRSRSATAPSPCARGGGNPGTGCPEPGLPSSRPPSLPGAFDRSLATPVCNSVERGICEALFVVAATAAGSHNGLFDGVHSFFHSGTWLLIRNLTLLFLVVFWLASAYWVYKDARRRLDDPWLVALDSLVGLIPVVGPLI